MDIRQTLLDTEMILKDFISMIISENLGENWLPQSGISEGRLREIEELRTKYQQDLHVMTGEGRLINYCNFSDLATIIETNWNTHFEVAFGYKQTINTYLSTLQKYNNPDAFNRPLMSFEKHLVLGLCGTIRNNISVFRSWKEVGKEGFPLIESVQDNFNNLWTMGMPKKLKTQLSIREGDLLEFVVTAMDPKDDFLEYRIFPNKWQNTNVLQYQLKRDDVGKEITFQIGIRSKRKYHAYPMGYDDRITIAYTVLPAD